jgi:taurine dioxygenase
MAAKPRATADNEEVLITPLQPAFGAEISNVDLRHPLTPGAFGKIRSACIRYKVIFFRDQDITSENQVAFARLFGEIQDYPVFRSSENSAMQGLKSKYAKADIWHTDLAWLERPPFAAVLRSQVIPDVGGDTMWADGERAYQNLPDDLKSQIDELCLVHDSSRIGAHYLSGEERERRLARVRELRKQYPLIAHPIAPTYPESGNRYLFVNPALAESIVGMSNAESGQLLDRLHQEYLRPENTLRFRWSKNAVAMWDERRTLHYGVYDYGDKERVLERVIIAGTDIPCR